jgi:ribosomal protein S18 acetylase RimI-like enzyme
MDEAVEEIRRAALADASAVRDLTRAAYAQWVPIMGREPKPMLADYEQAAVANLIDLLYVGGEHAALIEMVPKADHLLIKNIAVAPNFQGRGYGSKLMAHAERVAHSRGHKETRLFTNTLMATNIKLYIRLGYRTDREEPFKGGFVVHMSKLIEQVD